MKFKRERRTRIILAKRKSTVEYFIITENVVKEEKCTSWWIPRGLVVRTKDQLQDQLTVETAYYDLKELAKGYRSYPIVKDVTLKTDAKQRLVTTSQGHKIKVLEKYWRSRYELFSLWDHGIRLDDCESWYSVTPECIAEHTAASLGDFGLSATLLVVDAFCGAGGNAIQFALAGAHVIGVDCNQERLGMAKHNAAVYEVKDYIDFIHADWYTVCGLIRADAVFLSPPWGGPDYLSQPTYDLMTGLEDPGKMIRNALMVAPLVIFFLPKNTDLCSVGHLLRPLLPLLHPVVRISRYLMGGDRRHPKAISVYIRRRE